MFRRCVTVSSALCALLSVAGFARAATPYCVTDLGALNGADFSGALSINDSGQVTGYSQTSSNDLHAFLYSGGSIIDILPSGSFAEGTGINDSGQIVGFGDVTGQGPFRAFLYGNGTATDLGTLAGDAESRALGINAAGQVVGASYATSRRPFLYSNGTMVDLGTLPGGTGGEARAINASGQVVGEAYLSDTISHAFLYNNGTMTDLGGLGTWQGNEALGINATGQVIGVSTPGRYTVGGFRGFLYSNGAMSDLGTLPGYSETCPKCINDAGQVVGVCANDWPGPPNHAFLYNDGAMIDLNHLLSPTSGWIVNEANGINSLGWIVGKGTNPAGQTHAFLLTPALAGDANLDGTVDAADLARVLTNYDTAVSTWADADFDGNGKVDVDDLNKLLSNYNHRVGLSGKLPSVPEPPAIILLGIALSVLAWRRRRSP